MTTPLQAEQIAGEWVVSLRGVLRNLPIYDIPQDALYNSLNVLVRKAGLTVRPGLTSFAGGFVFPDLVTNAFGLYQAGQAVYDSAAFDNPTFQIATSIGEPVHVVGTLSKLYGYWSGSYHDITGSALTTKALVYPSEFTGIKIPGSSYFVLQTNGVDAPQQWDQTAGGGTFGAVAGSPPKFTDWTTISQHVIGILPPYDVYWGNNGAITSWPSANYWPVADTPDPVVAIKSMGTQGGFIYKSRTIWAITPQGGVESTYFFVTQVRQVDGPAGVRALVDANGPHIYMTDTGRIGYFDGVSHQWIADGIWPIVNADLDQANAGLICGCFEPFYKEVWFFYPRTGDSGLLKGAVCVILPRPADNINDYIGFPMRLTNDVTAATDLRISTTRKSLIFEGTQTLQSYTLEGGNDHGTAITGNWQTGLVGAKTLRSGFFTRPASNMFGIDAIQTYAQRGAGYGSLTLEAIYSYLLDAEGGTTFTGDPKTVDLTQNKVFEPMGQDVRGNFFGLYYTFTSPITLKWLGARLAASLLKG